MPIRFVMLAESRWRSSGSSSPQHFLERDRGARFMEDQRYLCVNSHPRSDSAFAGRYNKLISQAVSAS